MSVPLHLALVAGEASGDTHGAALMQELQKKIPNIIFSGFGGPKMTEAASRQFKLQVEAIETSNCKSIDNWIHESAVLGLWDVVKKYGYFRNKFSALLKQLEQEQPEAIVLIDYAGFNLRLAKAIRRRKLPIKIIKYISPQVWAWNRRRIPEMARNLDLMICIFPFEEKIYEASGLRTSFSGHPLVEKLMSLQPKLEREEALLGLFPGSRSREVHHIFPVMAAAAQRVISENSSVGCEAAAATTEQAHEMKLIASKIGLPITITVGQAHSLMQRATFGLVCSGTATLEAAALGLPYALVYKVTPITAMIARWLIKVPYLGIINILVGRPIIKEFLQEAATPQVLAQEASYFLKNQDAALELSREVTAIASTLRSEGSYERAAATIVEFLEPVFKVT